MGCKNTIIPIGVISIGSYAFDACYGLTSVTIPSSVTSIGNYAFRMCTGLTSIKAEWAEPLTIGRNVFLYTSISNLILYVPKGTKTAYAAADVWKDFGSIEEYTSDNAIYAAPLTMIVGTTGALSICLKNANETSAYSFDLMLPEGFSIETDGSNGFDSQVTLSSRHNGHAVTTNAKGNNIYSVSVLSLSSKALKDNDGAIMTIRLKAADELSEGEYEIAIKNARYSLLSGETSVSMADTKAGVTIVRYRLGDANGDGMVDIADAVTIVNYVVGKEAPSFRTAAADANGDGVVDIADAVRIVNLIVGKIDALAPRFERSLPEPE